MGVDTRLVVYAPDEPTAASACRAAFDRLADLEDVMSDYRPTSELMRLCAHAGGPPVPISPDLYRVLSQGQRIAAQSHGSFDMTVGPLSRLWRTARKSHQLPDPQSLSQAKSLTGYQNLLLTPPPSPTGVVSSADHVPPRHSELPPPRHSERSEESQSSKLGSAPSAQGTEPDPASPGGPQSEPTTPPTAQLLKKGMLLDLGGIAKGDAGDQALATLKQHGISSALYQAGGDIVLSNPPPGTTGWSIQIPHDPKDELQRSKGKPAEPPSTTRAAGVSPASSPSLTLTLSNCALSTSGDSNQYLDLNGTRYSHLLNPHTGLGLTSRTLVTVIAPTGLTSDPLSKAASILPPAQLRQLLPLHPHTTIYLRHLPLDHPATPNKPQFST